MPIVLYLGLNVKDYEEKSEGIITQAISGGRLRCALCLKPMKVHSSYTRTIKETGEPITITVVWCRKCRKWHALLPDFLLSHKHYSGNEIEAVVIDSKAMPVSHIETKASEPTARRWIKQMGERIKQAASKLRYHFLKAGHAVSEIKIDAGHCYDELEQILDFAPGPAKYSGNKLGLANIWLGATEAPGFI